MKAEITEDGYIRVCAETTTESIAMKAIVEEAEKRITCTHCGRSVPPVMLAYGLPKEDK